MQYIFQRYMGVFNILKGRVHKDRHTLISKHLDTKHNMDRLSVGGGVSLWPDMEDMRLSLIEILKLGALCFLLFVVVMMIFSKLHGECYMVSLTKIYSFFIFYHFLLLTINNNHIGNHILLFEITSNLFVKNNTEALRPYNHIAACHIIIKAVYLQKILQNQLIVV